jgi:hypothetical protein
MGITNHSMGITNHFIRIANTSMRITKHSIHIVDRLTAIADTLTFQSKAFSKCPFISSPFSGASVPLVPSIFIRL